jgi:hypothetical protein
MFAIAQSALERDIIPALAYFILPPLDENWSSRPDNGDSLAGLFYFRLAPMSLELQSDAQR